jgi:hypothetical protein
MHEPMETSSFKTEICQCENEDEEWEGKVKKEHKKKEVEGKRGWMKGSDTVEH